MMIDYKEYCEFLSDKYGRPYYPYFSLDGVLIGLETGMRNTRSLYNNSKK